MDNFNIGRSIETGSDQVFNFLPQLLAALLILLIGYLIVKAVSGLVSKGLQKVHFDGAVSSTSAGKVVSRVVDSPSKFVGQVAFWLLFLGVISAAVTALNLPILNQLLAAVYSYVPNVVAAVAIFLVASIVSAGAAAFVNRVMGDTAISRLIATIVPVLTMIVAGFMILNQLRIATDIVNILFTAIVGAVAVGFALAFGLGGRDIAREILGQAYESGRRNAAKVQGEVAHAAENTKNEARKLRNKANR